LYLRASLPASTGDVIEFGVPFKGWIDSVQFWSTFVEPIGLLSFLFAVVVAVVALVRRVRHPLWWAVVLNAALVVLLTSSVLAPERNSVRSLLSLQAVALIAIASPSGRGSRRRPTRRADPTGNLTPG
jgi:hypothetical protein